MNEWIDCNCGNRQTVLAVHWELISHHGCRCDVCGGSLVEPSQERFFEEEKIPGDEAAKSILNGLCREIGLV